MSATGKSTVSRPVREKLIRKGYTFCSDSDCEILLPLYEELGTEMFGTLDAEFALVLYDAASGSYIAARDPIGIRPLFYGYDRKGNILFASEAKNLTGLTESICPFPPGHYYKDGKFICYRDITETTEIHADSLDVLCRNIREKLMAGVKKRLDSDAPMGFLLSGGLDSSLVCAIAASRAGQTHPHLRHRHGKGCHRPEICQGNSRLYRKPSYGNSDDQRAGYKGSP